MEKQEIKQMINDVMEKSDTYATGLMLCALALAEILDQPIDKNGIIQVQYQFASEKIHDAQLAAKSAADELMFVKSELNSRLL